MSQPGEARRERDHVSIRRMNRRYRLKSLTDFRRVRRTGKSYAHPLAILVTSPNQLAVSRFGFSASRALGRAVSRNRAKRRLRAATQSYIHRIKPGWDAILIARPPLIEADWPQVQEALSDLFQRADLFNLDND